MMRRCIAIFFIIIALFYTIAPVTLQAQGGLDADRIRRATVYIMQTRNIGGKPVITCVGSGTIVHWSGLIVTNAHHTVSNATCPGDRLVIALSIRPGEPPVPTYYAEVAQADEGLDLALLRISQELNGRLVEPGTLTLPFVELGDSGQVRLDTTITVAGYPDVTGTPVEFERGTVSGFVAEPSGGERSWLKTDATIPGTMTGGGVYDQNGRLIAVPTTVPITSLIAEATCVSLEDTNNDDLINQNDRCVPIGGFINALRPSSFVRPLLRGASLGITVEKLEAEIFQFGSAGEPEFSRLIIAPAVTAGMPTTVARSLPTGTTSLYLFFDYANLTPETIYELRVTIDNIPSPTFSLAPVRWSGGERGLWYIGSSGQVWPDGIYEFTLFIDGLPAGNPRSIIIGDPEQNAPTFHNILFGIEEGDNLFGNAYVLPAGRTVSARFVHQNVPDGMLWREIWRFNDRIIRDTEEAWLNDGRDTKVTRVESAELLLPGRYRLELYLDGRMAATADFTIAGASEGALPRVFSNAHFTVADTPGQAAGNVAIGSFSGSVTEVYALFDWEQIAPSTLWRMRWLVDDVVFYEETVPWGSEDVGYSFLTRLSSTTILPDGTYRMELSVLPSQLVLGEAEMQVGIGQLPIDPLAQTVGVQLNGYIVDAETREGIPGVTFVVISEDYSVAEFVWDQEQVYALATTDRNGHFQLDRLLQFEKPYSVVIQADGYVPIQVDGVIVELDSENPLEISIPLTRD
jgi:hypothetical protein